MSSERLKGKVLLPLGNSNVLAQVVRRAQVFSHKVIVCTSVDKSDDILEDFCDEIKVDCFRGSLDNVFSRYHEIIDKFPNTKYKWFARLTADNPLISNDLADHMISKIRKDLDYISYKKNTIPIGTAIELVNIKTFLDLKNSKLDLPQKEHVTLKLYERENEYNCLFLDPPSHLNFPNYRFTLDYQEDYELLKNLFDYNNNISAEQAIIYINNNKEIANINKGCAQKIPRTKFS